MNNHPLDGQFNDNNKIIGSLPVTTSNELSVCLHSSNNLQSHHLSEVLADRLNVPVTVNSALISGSLDTSDSVSQVHLIDATSMSAQDLINKLVVFERAITNQKKTDSQLPAADSCAYFNVAPSTDLELRSKYSGWRSLRGLFYADQGMDVLVKGMRAIFRGEIWLPRNYLSALMTQVTPRLPDEERLALLTEKETQILALLAVGLTNDQIGEKLYISPHTVKTHLYKLYRKISARNRVDAANWAQNNLDRPV